MTEVKFRLLTLSFLILVGITMYSCASNQGAFTLTSDEFAQQINNSTSGVILDVRTPQEFAGGHIANARNIDLNSAGFMAEIKTLEKSQPYFVYCLSGGRSEEAVEIMLKEGFTEVYNLKGGLLSWQSHKHPVVGDSHPGQKMDKISMTEYADLVNSGPIVLIDFYAPWCGPCKKMEPMLADFARENNGVRVVRLNVDENRGLAEKLGVSEIPVIKVFKAGKEVWMHQGFVEKPELVKATKKL